MFEKSVPCQKHISERNNISAACFKDTSLLSIRISNAVQTVGRNQCDYLPHVEFPQTMQNYVLAILKLKMTGWGGNLFGSLICTS